MAHQRSRHFAVIGFCAKLQSFHWLRFTLIRSHGEWWNRRGGKTIEVNKFTLIKAGGRFCLPYSTFLTVLTAGKGMVMKYAAVCLVALSVFCGFCDGQWSRSRFFRPSPRAYPVLQPNPSDTQQSTQIGTTLTWQFPAPPQTETIPVGTYTPKQPVSPASVAVTCSETSAHVEVKEDLFGTGQLVIPTGLTLGTCSPTSQDSVADVLIFDVELQACGSTLSVRTVKWSIIPKERKIYNAIIPYFFITIYCVPRKWSRECYFFVLINC